MNVVLSKTRLLEKTQFLWKSWDWSLACILVSKWSILGKKAILFSCILVENETFRQKHFRKNASLSYFSLVFLSCISLLYHSLVFLSKMRQRKETVSQSLIFAMRCKVFANELITDQTGKANTKILAKSREQISEKNVSVFSNYVHNMYMK